MAPPSATETETSHASEKAETPALLEPGIPESAFKNLPPGFPHPPVFKDKLEERAYQKGRLALAFRIFAKLGFDEGVAGHITLRVCSFPFDC